MPATRIETRVAIAVCCAIAALGVVAAAQGRVTDPPANTKRIQPIQGKVTKRSSVRFDSGFPWQSGVHVYSAAEAKAE